ncbi:hypothetical protein GNI_075910 [Gregarina niphandrodes]|uniref:Transmembrane protein n=1 Tax=Gregarina niphandrodes TaxID=110365 RepID=A0A023B6W2_GRENI|nr:hypothetical protein GNI_075910 [Gregarina niphandrodes]EZG66778.1 hypothetical protein GNI_075910 [Gregarina niphandrodes]|eukprot:XP_011130489.1 hypothetical protein GNI_075910 [Gregarina niphandrodes]
MVQASWLLLFGCAAALSWEPSVLVLDGDDETLEGIKDRDQPKIYPKELAPTSGELSSDTGADSPPEELDKGEEELDHGGHQQTGHEDRVADEQHSHRASDNDELSNAQDGEETAPSRQEDQTAQTPLPEESLPEESLPAESLPEESLPEESPDREEAGHPVDETDPQGVEPEPVREGLLQVYADLEVARRDILRLLEN